MTRVMNMELGGRLVKSVGVRYLNHEDVYEILVSDGAERLRDIYVACGKSGPGFLRPLSVNSRRSRRG